MKMKFNIYSILILMLSFCNFTFCNLLDNVFSLYSTTANKLSSFYYNEYCTDKHVPYNLSSLKTMLHKNLYGQHIAINIVFYTIQAHLAAPKNNKPLILSFHGANGVGKTYVTRMIAQAFFEKGESSRYFHLYYGLDSFPLKNKVQEYQVKLKSEIQKAIDNCEKSLFVFDGVDQIPHSLLDILIPFVDCSSCGSKTKKNRAVFIFLTNTGSVAIENQLLKKMNEGVARESTVLQDYESSIISEALHLKGGLFESLLIKSDAIDFYVPFLPLEKRHVKYCINIAYQELNVTPTADLVDKVFKELRFGPEPEKLFSKSGCKRVPQIVGRNAARLLPEFEDFEESHIKFEL